MKRLILGALVACFAREALAHELWIEPSSFRPGAGERVMLQLRVGRNYLGDSVPRDPESIAKFVAYDAAGVDSVRGLTGRSPAGVYVARARGPVVIAYESRGAIARLAREEFRNHLIEQGLDPALARGGWRGGTSRDVSERFIRCAKSILEAVDTEPADRVVGMPLELVATSLPGDARRSVALQLWNGASPLGNARVTVISRRDPSKRVSGRTDRRGRVVLQLDGGGPWLATSVLMTEGPRDEGIDWTSYWASLTFD